MPPYAAPTDLQDTHAVCAAEDLVRLVVVRVADGGRRDKQLKRVVLVHVQLPALDLLLQLLHPLLAMTGAGRKEGQNGIGARHQGFNHGWSAIILYFMEKNDFPAFFYILLFFAIYQNFFHSINYFLLYFFHFSSLPGPLFFNSIKKIFSYSYFSVFIIFSSLPEVDYFFCVQLFFRTPGWNSKIKRRQNSIIIC